MKQFVRKTLRRVLEWIDEGEEAGGPPPPPSFSPRVRVIELQRIDEVVCVEADAIEEEFRELIRGLDLEDGDSDRLLN